VAGHLVITHALENTPTSSIPVENVLKDLISSIKVQNINSENPPLMDRSLNSIVT